MPSSINGKELKYGALRGPIFAEGIGQISQTLNPVAVGSKVIKMTVEEPWILVEMKDNVGKLTILAIPIAAFTHTVLAKS